MKAIQSLLWRLEHEEACFQHLMQHARVTRPDLVSAERLQRLQDARQHHPSSLLALLEDAEQEERDLYGVSVAWRPLRIYSCRELRLRQILAEAAEFSRNSPQPLLELDGTDPHGYLRIDTRRLTAITYQGRNEGYLALIYLPVPRGISGEALAELLQDECLRLDLLAVASLPDVTQEIGVELPIIGGIWDRLPELRQLSLAACELQQIA